MSEEEHPLVQLGDKFRGGLDLLIGNIIKVLKATISKIKVTRHLDEKEEYAWGTLDYVKKAMTMADDTTLIVNFIRSTYHYWNIIAEDKVKFLYEFSKVGFNAGSVKSDFSFLFSTKEDKITTVITDAHVGNLIKCFRSLIKSSISFLDLVFSLREDRDDILELLNDLELSKEHIEALKIVWLK